SPRHRIGEEDAPAVVGHLHVVEVRPALVIHAHGGPEVNLVLLEAFGAHLLPPVDELRLPRLQRALELLVGAEIDVVGNPLRIDHRAHVRLQSNSGRSGRPYIVSAPRSPTALGRWKIQFCQAESRAKILVSSVSGPAKRRFASIPVSASGERLTRSSIARRTSSSQSIASGVNVTSPRFVATRASRSSVTFASSVTRSGVARKRVARRERPFDMASGPKFIASTPMRTCSSSSSPSSMYERSA